MGNHTINGWRIRGDLVQANGHTELTAAFDASGTWRTDVLDWLMKNLPEYAGHFVNSGGHPFTGELVDDKVSRGELLADHDTCQQRLGEIMLKL
jgi:hypothetical protein